MRPTTTLIVASALLLSGCSSDGIGISDSSPSTVGYQPGTRIDSSCGILQPFFAVGSMGLGREDLDTRLKTEFAKWDKDNSGDLSNAELNPLNEYLHAEFKAVSSVIDWDGNGRVSFKV